MLSIRKLRLEDVNYLLALAQEDYYLNGGEPPGEWYGEGAASLGLDGLVENDPFRNMFEGFSPDGKIALVQNAGQTDGYHKRVPGWDLTFSAPKSVSVFWSQAPAHVRKAIEKAHRDAVKTALSIMEDLAGITRRSPGGKVWEKAAFVYAVFLHGTSREQEPQLHDHAILFNLGCRNDGTTGAIRSEALFDYKMGVGAIYRCQFAANLERDCHLRTEKVDTWFDLAGVDHDLMERFSTRRKQILEHLQECGFHSSKAAERAAIETRQVKGHIARDLLFKHWQEIGNEHGWSQMQALGLLQAKPIERNLTEEKERVIRSVVEEFKQGPRWPTKAALIEVTAQHAQASGLDAQQVLNAVKELEKTHNMSSSKRQQQSKPAHEAAQNTDEQTIPPEEPGAGGPHAAPGHEETQSSQHTEQATGAEAQEEKTGGDKTTTNVSEEEPQSVTTVSNEQRVKSLLASREIWKSGGFSVSKAKGDYFPMVFLNNDNKTVRLEILTKTPFTKAPDWNPLNSLHLPHFTISVEGGPKFGDLKKQWNTRFYTIESRDKFLFPFAWHFTGGQTWKLPSRTFNLHSDPFGWKRGLNAMLYEKQKLTAKDVRALVDRIMAVGARLTGGSKQAAVEPSVEHPERDDARIKFATGETHKKTVKALLDHWKRKGIIRPEKNLILTMSERAAQTLNRAAQYHRLLAGKLSPEFAVVRGEKIHRKDRVRLMESSSVYGITTGDTGTVTRVSPHKMSILLDSGKLVRISLEHYQSIDLGYAVAHHLAPRHSPRRTFILFEGINSHFELDEIHRRAWSSKVKVYAEVNAAERALEEIKREREREMRRNQDPSKEQERKHEQDHSHSH